METALGCSRNVDTSSFTITSTSLRDSVLILSGGELGGTKELRVGSRTFRASCSYLFRTIVAIPPVTL